MSDYLTIEQVKEKMRGVIFESNSTDYQRGYNAAIIATCCILDRLEPSDAKLRRLREVFLADPRKHFHYIDIIKIIDSHPTPSEPTEAEKLRKEADELIERINNAVDKLGK